MPRFLVEATDSIYDLNEFYYFDHELDALEFIETKLIDNYTCTLSHTDSTNLYESRLLDTSTMFINSIVYSSNIALE